MSSNASLAASQIHNVDAKGFAASTLEVESMRSLGINPSHALQHPGFYYAMAAKCTEMRRERFLSALELENSQKTTISSPGFANEKKVDHLTIVLELYTKAYELFKKYTVINPQNPTQGRLTLWIAYRIAHTYYESGKYDMAIRFFERIAKTYRREKWGPLLRPLLSTWYACARELGDTDLSVKLLVEMLGHDVNEEESTSLEEDLMAILSSTTPTSEEVLVVDLSESQPIFDSNVVFWAPEVKVGDPAAFQLSLVAPKSVSMSSLPISSLTIYFSHRDLPLVVRHKESEVPSSSLFQWINLGHISSSSEAVEDVVANLRWQAGGCFVFSGTVSSDLPISLKVSKLLLTMEEGTWKIEIPFDPCSFRHGFSPVSRWLSSIDPPQYVPVKREGASSVNVRYRSHTLAVSLTHESPAYLNEEYPITINITNADSRPLDVVVDVLLPPTEIDDAVNTIILGDDRSSNFIKGVHFGTLAPGVSAVKTLYLVNTGAPGDRVVDISIQSRPINAVHDVTNPELQDMTETLRTLVIPTIDPLKVTQTISYTRGLAEWPGLADLKTFDGDLWNNSRTNEALVTTRIECAGPSALQVGSVRLERHDHKRAQIVECSADFAEASVSDYHPGDELAYNCRIAIASPEDKEEGPVIQTGSYHITWQRIWMNGDRGSLSTTMIPLPALEPPVEGLLALLSAPPVATLHVPVSLVLTVRNYHPSRSANVVVQLELDASDSFVVAGLRSGRIPILMPGEEEKLTWKLIPIECGHIRIPRITVMDKRPTVNTGVEPSSEAGTKGELVEIVDVRLDRRPVRTIDASQGNPDLEDGGIGTVLVLP